MKRLNILVIACLLCATTLILVFTLPCLAEAYVLSPEDQIDISVLGHDDFKSSVTLLPDGTFTYPILGNVHAAGQTIDALTETLAYGLSSQLNQPSVTVTLRQGRPRKVSVLGTGAKTPGQYDYKAGMHLLDLIALSGGPDSRPEVVQATLVTDGGKENTPIDLPKLLSGTNTSQNLPLASGDILFLTLRDASLTQVQVLGEVNKPGAYDVPSDGVSLISLLNIASGATTKAALTQTQVLHGGHISVYNLHRLMTQNLSDAVSLVRLVPGDVLLIPTNTAHVLALGEMATKGVFPIPDGETLPLTVALALTGGVTAEGDKKNIDIVRRRPDGTMSVVAINMADLFSGKKSTAEINLQSGDILYVPTRNHPKSAGDVLTALSPLAILGTLSHL